MNLRRFGAKGSKVVVSELDPGKSEGNAGVFDSCGNGGKSVNWTRLQWGLKWVDGLTVVDMVRKVWSRRLGRLLWIWLLLRNCVRRRPSGKCFRSFATCGWITCDRRRCEK